MENSNKTLRLDKWLNFACIIKTRSQATKACEDGRVKVNNQVAKPSKMITIGDVVSLKHKSHTRTFDVVDLSAKNVSHQEARKLYREHELSAEEKEALEIQQMLYKAGASFRPKYKGRPTKRERRQLEKFRNNPFGDDDGD